MAEPLGRILVALDVPTLGQAKSLADQLRGRVGGFKVGSQLCTAAGVPAVIEAVGQEVFLDLKYGDIPNTVAASVEAAARQRVMMCNVHCTGGSKMMRAAVAAARKVFDDTGHVALVIGVTILTSLDKDDLDEIGLPKHIPIQQRVADLAALAQECGLDGVVCSPKEIEAVRRRTGNGFFIVTPGIRSASDPADDQNRTATAVEAVGMGATYLVVGRPIIAQPDPLAAADAMNAEIGAMNPL